MTLKKQEGLHQKADPDDTDNAQIQEFKKARRFKGDDASIVKRSKGQGKIFKKRKLPETKELPQTEEGKPDWKRVKLDSKLLKEKRKQKNVGNNETFNLSVKAKKIWEEMRREVCDKERQQVLSKELYSLIEGKVSSLIYAHDTVRVVETLIACGGEKYRSFLFVELKDELQTLSKNKYSRFFVLKLLRYGTRAQKDAIINSLLGNIPKLMRNKIASDVVELAYNDYANAKQRSSMIQEFFGPRFRHFKDESVASLSAALEKSPEHKKTILTDVHTCLMPIIEKGIFTNTLIHTLLRQYLECSEGAERSTVVEALREVLLPIIHTRDGARVAMMCLWFGAAKDRKLLLRKFKGQFLKIAQEEHGHMVLLAAFDCVDDTVFVKKAVLDELFSSENLPILSKSDIGIKVLKYLVVPRNPLFFHPDITAILAKGDGNTNSKKDAEVRRNELRVAIETPVLELLKEHISTWARAPYRTLFIGSTLQHFNGDLVTDIFKELAEICAEPYIPGNDDHFIEKSFMNKMMTFLITCDKQRHIDGKDTFSTHLIDAAETEMRGWIMVNRGCFMLVKLIETEIPSVVETVKAIVTPLKAKLNKFSFVGASILQKKLD